MSIKHSQGPYRWDIMIYFVNTLKLVKFEENSKKSADISKIITSIQIFFTSMVDIELIHISAKFGHDSIHTLNFIKGG